MIQVANGGLTFFWEKEMKILVFVVMVMGLGCDTGVQEERMAEKDSPYRFSRTAIGYSMDRLENDEVICYRFNRLKKAGLSCMWKGR